MKIINMQFFFKFVISSL